MYEDPSNVVGSAARAHCPSGDNATARPSPRRTADAPLVLRTYTEDCGPPPTPTSVNSMKRPSLERSTGTGRSSHVQVPLARLTGRKRSDASAVVRSGHQEAPVWRHVMEAGVPGETRDLTRRSTGGDRVDRIAKQRAIACGSEPDLVAFPGKAEAVEIARGHNLLGAGTVDDNHGPDQPTCARQLVAGDAIPVARHAWKTESSPWRGWLGDNGAQRILEPLDSIDEANHRKVATIRREVGVLDALGEFARHLPSTAYVPACRTASRP